jgi:hypothetical protein
MCCGTVCRHARGGYAGALRAAAEPSPEENAPIGRRLLPVIPGRRTESAQTELLTTLNPDDTADQPAGADLNSLGEEQQAQLQMSAASSRSGQNGMPGQDSLTIDELSFNLSQPTLTTTRRKAPLYFRRPTTWIRTISRSAFRPKRPSMESSLRNSVTGIIRLNGETDVSLRN